MLEGADSDNASLIRATLTIQQMLLTHFGVTGRPTLLARADEVIE